MSDEKVRGLRRRDPARHRIELARRRPLARGVASLGEWAWSTAGYGDGYGDGYGYGDGDGYGAGYGYGDGYGDGGTDPRPANAGGATS